MSDVDTLQAEIAPPTPAWGERAAQIRKLAIKYPELSKADIAKRVGCTWENVDQVLGRFLGTSSMDDVRGLQANRADIFDALQYRMLSSITDEDVSNASLLQRVTASAILYDKARLERGQATSINVTALLDVAKLIRDKDGQ